MKNLSLVQIYLYVFLIFDIPFGVISFLLIDLQKFALVISYAKNENPIYFCYVPNLNCSIEGWIAL